MKNPQEMTPMEMRAFMREAQSLSNEVRFRNAQGQTIFAVIYVEGAQNCERIIEAVSTVTDTWGTEETETKIPL